MKAFVVKMWAHQGLNQGPPDYEGHFCPFLNFTQRYLNSLKPLLAKGFSDFLALHLYQSKTGLMYFCLQIVCTLFAMFPFGRPPD
jgi:hypothetical protein